MKSFLDNRTSWKFFNKKFGATDALVGDSFHGFNMVILIEILKELQFMNDQRIKSKDSNHE